MKFFKIFSLAFLIINFSCCDKYNDITDPYLIHNENRRIQRNYHRFSNDLKKKYGTTYKISSIGAVKYKNSSYHIFNFHKEKKNCKKILIIASCHGNEPAGSYAVKSLLSWFATQNFEFDIIPILNPFGWERHYRYNGKGENINRDYKTFKTQEGKIMDLFLTDKKYDLIIDIHSAWSKGYFIYCYNKKYYNKAEETIKKIADNNFKIDYRYKNYFRSKNGIVKEKKNFFSKLIKHQTFGYYVEKNITEEIYTLEARKEDCLEDQKKSHIIAIKYIIENLQ